MRNSLSRQMRLLIVYFGEGLFAEILFAYLGSKGINNLWLLHLFTIIDYCLLIAVFALWQKNILLRRILQISIPLIIILGIISILYLENIRHFNNFTRPMTSLILTMVSAYTLFELNTEKIVSLFREPRFWVCSGVVLYFTSTLLIFSLSNILLNLPHHLVRVIFEFNIIMNIVANIIYTRGFLCQVRTV